MAYTKAQLEAIKNTLLASNQPILASQHRSQIQSMIDEMYDSQSRGNILVGVQSDTVQGGSDTLLIFRAGQAYQIPLSLFSATTLAGLGDVFISDVQNGDSIVYNTVNNRWENQNILLEFAIFNLSDVELTSLNNGDILRYDSVSQKWENESLATILSPYALLTDLDDYQLLSEKGQVNGYASLDGGGKVPAGQLPSYVDDVLEFANLASFPTPGETGKIYVALDTNKTYRWSGSAYIEISASDVNSVFGRLGNVVANAADYNSFYVRHDTNAQGLNTTQQSNARININAIGGTIAASQVAFGTGANVVGGDDGLFWDNTNKRLRINQTADAGFRLDVNGTARVQGATTVEGNVDFNLKSATNPNALFGISFRSNVNTERAIFKINWNNGEIRIGGNNGGGYFPTFYSNGSEAARFSTSQNLLLNTTTDAGFRLDVNGTARISNTLRLDTRANATGNFATFSATGVLQERTAAEVRTDIGGIGGSGTAGQVSFWTGAGVQSGDNGLVWDNVNKRLGVGTNVPNIKMVIQDGGSSFTPISSLFKPSIGIATDTILIGGLDFKNFNSNGQVRLLARNDQDDYIVINTFGSSSSGSLFGISRNNISAVLSQSSGDNSKKLAIGTFNAGDLILGTNNNERLRITVNGNVGIGTTAPSEKLHVSGTLRLDTRSNATGNFATFSATGVLQERTAAEVVTDLNVGALKTAVDTTIGAMKYSGQTRETASFYGGFDQPFNSTLLNYDGNFRCVDFTSIGAMNSLGGFRTGEEVLVPSIANGSFFGVSIPTNQTVIITVISSTTGTNTHGSIIATDNNGTFSMSVLHSNNLTITVAAGAARFTNNSGSTLDFKFKRMRLM